MDKLKGFLIKKLILVLIIVVTIELFITGIINYIFFPIFGFVMGHPEMSSFSVSKLPFLFWDLITGNSTYILSKTVCTEE